MSRMSEHAAHSHPTSGSQGSEHQKGHHHTDHSGHEEMFRRRFWVSLLLSIPVIVLSPTIQEWFNLSVPDWTFAVWLVPVISTVVFVYGGTPFLSMATVELRNRKPGMMTLISLAISVAYVYSMAAVVLQIGDKFFWELVTLIDVMLLGHWIEMRSVRQASGALDALASLMPDSAERVLDNGDVENVTVDELVAGDLVLVRPGSSFPADGVVVDGDSSVDESMITGESAPVSKSPGSQVTAGTINGDGSLRVEVGAIGEETALSGIMRLVKEAQASKSETQILADRAAGWLFYAALASAAVTAVVWILFSGPDVDVVKRVVTVLVIACPHALGLAIPLVVSITSALGARNGILIRDRLALESAKDLDVVVFDKTGTLTKGEHGVVRMKAGEHITEEQALGLAAAVENDSEHMIARAILQEAQNRSVQVPKATGFSANKGRGVSATIDGRQISVGGPQLLTELGVSVQESFATFVKEAQQAGHAVIYLVEEKKVLACFETADVTREESREAVESLKQQNVRVVLLTGDSEAVARSVAVELGIDEYFAEVLPEDKDKKIVELQRDGSIVAMVGDGVNDAPALARADVGIAIGGGTDVAIESAHIILVRNDPRDVAKVVHLSSASYRKMIQNIWWAAGYNIVAIPLAAGILAPVGFVLPIAVGALVMSASTVVVALNAQLLRRAL